MKIKDIFKPHIFTPSKYELWIFILFMLISFWLSWRILERDGIALILISVCALFLWKISTKKNQKFLATNISLYHELKRSPPTLMGLKQQELLLYKFASDSGKVRYNKNLNRYIYPEFFIIENEKIFFFQELKNIQTEREKILQNPEKSEEIELQKHLIKVYENQEEWRNRGASHPDSENISKMLWKQKIKKCILIYITSAIFWGIIILMFGMDYIWVAIFFFLFLFIFLLVSNSDLYFSRKNELDFADGRDFMIYFLRLSYNKIPHPTDILIFADVIEFFTKNIVNRDKNIKYNENLIRKWHSFFFFHFQIPTEMQNFLTEEKKKLKNDAEVVQKIIQKWSEIEKLRLEKERESSQNPLILASNKRREIMIKNLENINKNL